MNIEMRQKEMQRRQIAINMSYYKTNGNAPHFYFGNPFDNVLEKVSEELPPYK